MSPKPQWLFRLLDEEQDPGGREDPQDGADEEAEGEGEGEALDELHQPQNQYGAGHELALLHRGHASD